MVVSLAQGVSFDAESHEYWYKGKKLSGVTGIISKKLNQKLPEYLMGEHQVEGIHIHTSVAQWIETGVSPSIHPGVAWVVKALLKECNDRISLHAEVLVTDYKQYASAVDVVYEHDGKLSLYDIKKGIFNREYCTWQLSIYKYLIEKHTEWKVGDLWVLCIKDETWYPIVPKDAGEVEELLYA